MDSSQDVSHSPSVKACNTMFPYRVYLYDYVIQQEVSAMCLYCWAQNQALISIKFAAMLKQMVICFVMCCVAASQLEGLMGQ